MRNSQKPKAASTQQHLTIAQIRDSMVIMKDGTLRAVLVVSSVNFALKSSQEQDAIIYQFQAFINSLNHPVQIVIQSRQLDLSGYIQKLGAGVTEQTNELLRFQMVDYIDFVSRLVTLANIMDKRFFVVIPHDAVKSGSSGLMDMFLGGRKTVPKYTQQQFNLYHTQITERVNVAISGLASMGLRSVQLNTQELVEFYYSIYNPEEAVEEKLVDADALRSGIVQRGVGNAPSDEGGLNVNT
jgi:hypothetical protein